MRLPLQIGKNGCQFSVAFGAYVIERWTRSGSVDIFRKGKRLGTPPTAIHDDPIAANVLARDFTAAAPHLEGPQLAGSHERTPDADRNAAERL
jgi:hypothetical protein